MHEIELDGVPAWYYPADADVPPEVTEDVFRYEFRYDALTVDHPRTDVFDVVDIDVGLRRCFPHGFTGLTLWSRRGGKRYVGREWHLAPAWRPKRAEYREAGLRPLIIPVVDLSAGNRARLRAFLEAGGITFAADAEGRTVWNSSFV